MAKGTKTAKMYDAVAEVRKVRDRLAEEMQGMSAEEQVRYLQHKLEEARAKKQDRDCSL